MRFAVGPYRYKLRIADEPIFLDGQESFAVVSESDRTITLSPKCLPRNRLPVIAHELTHAWCFACGEPTTLESWCDLAATMAAALLKDLRCQGGEEALTRLEPGESLSAKTATLHLTRNRYCMKCEATIAGYGVQCLPADNGELELALYCEGCGHVQRWRETASESGLPSGAVIGQPCFERGEAVATFLADCSAASSVQSP